MAYGWKIELSGVDVSEQVARFTITADRGQFCREAVVDFADPDFFAGLDLSVLPAAPTLEIFTRTGESWVSQGKFFVERPAYQTDVDREVANGVWGRSAIAALAKPFAAKVSRTWTANTTFFAICAEMCALAGLPFSSAYSDVDDYTVWGYAYQADGVYPIDVIAELAEACGAYVSTDRAGNVCIRQIDYSPAAADDTVTDADIQAIDESPEWPEFGNRLRISPSVGFAGYSVQLTAAGQCLPADGDTHLRLLARVMDADGLPVDDVTVSWSSDAQYAHLQWTESTTGEILITGEPVRATSYHELSVALPADSVESVYAASDLAHATNLAAGGASIDGNRVTLTDALAYCDQSLIVNYRVSGTAINWLTAGATPEDVTVTVDVAGARAELEVYIGNPCRCPLTLRIEASPTTIHIGEVARVLVYAEEDGGPVTTGRPVWMGQDPPARGALAWDVARLGQVTISNEAGAVVNELAGNSQVLLRMFAASVASVYQADEDGNAIGGNLYLTASGKRVTLISRLPTGTAVVANYTARGAAVNQFTGESLGTAKLRAWMRVTTEEPLEDACTVQIVDETEAIDDAPVGWDPDDDADYGGSGGIGEFDDTQEAGCRQDDGEIVQCGSGERCCWSGGNFGCFPEEECDVYGELACAPEDISDSGDTAGRFEAALAAGCTCEQICHDEFSKFATTQGYDGGSYRTVDEILLADYGLAPTDADPAAYWEKHGEIKAAALADCLEECAAAQACNCQGLAWDADASVSVLDRGIGGTVAVTSGPGRCGPYHWSVSGTGFSLAAEITEAPENVVTADETACGAASIVVVGCDGTTVRGAVKCTEGSWHLCGEGNRADGPENNQCNSSTSITLYYSDDGIFKATSDGTGAWTCVEGNKHDFVAECNMPDGVTTASLRQIASEYLNSDDAIYEGWLEEALVLCKAAYAEPCVMSLGPVFGWKAAIWYWGC
jgi:hypothetical protein